MSDQYQPQSSGHPNGWMPPAPAPIPATPPAYSAGYMPVPASAHHGGQHPSVMQQPQVVVIEQPAPRFIPQPVTQGPNPFVPAVARRDGAFGLALGMLLIALVFAAALAMQAHLPGYQPEAAPAEASPSSDFTPVTPTERARQ